MFPFVESASSLLSPAFLQPHCARRLSVCGFEPQIPGFPQNRVVDSATLMMASSSSAQHSKSLQIPSTDSNPDLSRHYNQSTLSPPSGSAAARPTSVAVASSVTNGSSATVPSRRQRASHTVVSPSSNPQNQDPSNSADGTAPIIDIHSHPAAVAYAVAHPRRQIPKFGPYLLLQTLGEGEFGKVKLGLHCQYGEEVAVKLIRRGNIDTTVRMSKVEREIEVLKTLKHPSIVRLYDVIETDKYIGIILEYASGGELFDHILAHRFLQEKYAAKLFSQLISGVWYIHQKKIVHRDLKLENLLLDRHRNVIITDFGFANRFEHRADDLMQTSCGSPCYAAPELVISEGLYVGSAVDIWSCGVILYAMLAGYLPFDDDPANPDGDNINLLYKYIVNTPLSFPDNISTEARDLLSTMLVPDPTRRTTLDGVMRHPWLAAYHSTRTDGLPNAFGKTIEDLERAAMDQHQQRRLAYQRQLRANAPPSGAAVVPPSRTQSHRPEHGSTPSGTTRSRSAQPEYLYDSSVDQSIMSPPATASVLATPTQNGTTRAFGSPAALGLSEDDPFAGPGHSAGKSAAAAPTPNTASSSRPRTSEDAGQVNSGLSPAPQQSKGHKRNSTGGGGFRHTIQVEYDDPSSKGGRGSEDKRRERSGSQGQASSSQHQHLTGVPAVPVAPTTPAKGRRSSQSSSKPLPPSPPDTNGVAGTPTSYRGTAAITTPKPAPLPNNATPTKGPRLPEINGSQNGPETLVVNVSAPPITPRSKTSGEHSEKEKDNGSQNSNNSTQRGHKRGKSSIDKLGLGKIFGSGFGSAPPLPSANGNANPTNRQGSTATSPSDGGGSATSVLLSPATEKEPVKKNVRRNTLTVMVEPISRSIRNRKGRMASTENTSASNGTKFGKSGFSVSPQAQSATLSANTAPVQPVDSSAFPASADLGDMSGLQASTSKARKVMQWFRTKSKGRDSVGFGTEEEEAPREKLNAPTQPKYRKGYSASSGTVNQTSASSGMGLKESAMSPVRVVITTPNSAISRPAAASSPMYSGHQQRSASTATDSSFTTPGFVTRFRNSVTVGGGSHQSAVDKSHPYGQLRIHHGAVDQTTITTRPPPEVMAHVKKILEGMGVDTQLESEYKYRCIRPKKKKNTVGQAGAASTGNAGLAAVTMVGSAASNGVDRRGLPLPSPSTFSSGMLRGLLMRRQSSQVSSHGPSTSQPSLAFDDETSVVVSEPLIMQEATYGDPTQDGGDEVRFSVELTRLDRLHDTYSLDIRRLRGNLRSYKFLYDTIRDRADLSATQA